MRRVQMRSVCMPVCQSACLSAFLPFCLSARQVIGRYVRVVYGIQICCRVCCSMTENLSGQQLHLAPHDECNHQEPTEGGGEQAEAYARAAVVCI